MNFILGIIAASKVALSQVLDLFNRSDNATDLGTISGQRWKVWRGVWGIFSNKAFSSSSPSENALATLKFTKTDVSISISGADVGTGAAFWVTDGDNWYASVYTQNEVCQTCSNCNSWNSQTCNSTNPVVCGAVNPVVCQNWNSQNCATTANGNCSNSGQFCCVWSTGNCRSWTLGNCTAWNNSPPVGFCAGPSSRNPSTCSGGWNTICNGNCCNGAFPNWGWHCTSWNNSNCQFATGGNCIFNTGGNCNSWNTSNCNAFFSFSCDCVIENKISILRSISNVVNEISNNLFSLAIQSFKIILSGNQVTIKTYSQDNYTSQIGNSIEVSTSAPEKTTQHGIIKSTSNYEQGSSIKEFGVE